MGRLQHIQTATANFPYLQGLQAVPVGLFCLAYGIGAMGVDPLSVVFIPLTWPATLAFVSTLLLTLAAEMYYRRVFGKVKPLPLSPYLKALLISAPIAVITGLVIDFQMLLPVSLFNLAVGLSILIYPFVVGLQERWHYLVLGVPIITVSLLPLITGTTLSHRLYGSGGALFYVAIGTACIVGGIIDHIRLVRNIRQAREALHA